MIAIVDYGAGNISSVKKALEHLDDLRLDDQARELFLAGNARRVFSL